MRMTTALAGLALVSITSGGDRVAAMIHVAAGPHAGSYLISSDDVPCEITTHAPPQPHRRLEITVARSGAAKDSAQLALLMLVVPDAGAHGPQHAFFTSIAFGSASHGTRYEMEARSGQQAAGNGTVTIATRGQDATVSLDVTSAQGVAFSGTIQCTDVLRR
jgi:hypothetical protein